MFGVENTPELRKSLARIIALAWVDPEYKARLLSSPKEVFTEEGIALPKEVNLTVVEDTPTHRNIVLADKPLPPQNRVTALPPNPDFYSIHAHIYERAREDPEFKQQLKAAPAEVVRILGAKLAPFVTFSVYEDTPTQRYFILPLTPRARVTTEVSPPGVIILDATAVNANVNVNANVQANVNVQANINADMQVNGAAVATVVVAVAVLI